MDDQWEKEWRQLACPERVDVEVPVRWVGSFCVPCASSEEQVSASFLRMTYRDNQILSAMCEITVQGERGEQKETDYNRMRLLMVRRCLVEWSLGLPLDREDGWLTRESFERVLRLPAPLVDAFVFGYERHVGISDDEEATMTRQAAILFSPNTGGVTDACPAVSLFCNLGNFWDKFGLNRFELAELPYLEFVRLKMMISKENAAQRRKGSRRGSGAGFRSETRVVGPGGRIRPSRAVVVGRD